MNKYVASWECEQNLLNEIICSLFSCTCVYSLSWWVGGNGWKSKIAVKYWVVLFPSLLCPWCKAGSRGGRLCAPFVPVSICSSLAQPAAHGRAVLETGGQGCSRENIGSSFFVGPLWADASLLRFFDYTCADSTYLQPWQGLEPQAEKQGVCWGHSWQ